MGSNTVVPQISDSEWEVMNVVWELPGVSAAEVVDRLGERTGWHPNTVKTLLGRLVKKGALAFEVDGNRYLYRARLPRERVVRQEARSFLSRVFGGQVTPLVAHFVESGKLSDAEIEELRRLLDSQER